MVSDGTNEIFWFLSIMEVCRYIMLCMYVVGYGMLMWQRMRVKYEEEEKTKKNKKRKK